MFRVTPAFCSSDMERAHITPSVHGDPLNPYLFLENALCAVPSSSVLDWEVVLYWYIYICTISWV